MIFSKQPAAISSNKGMNLLFYPPLDGRQLLAKINPLFLSLLCSSLHRSSRSSQLSLSLTLIFSARPLWSQRQRDRGGGRGGGHIIRGRTNNEASSVRHCSYGARLLSVQHVHTQSAFPPLEWEWGKGMRSYDCQSRYGHTIPEEFLLQVR